MRIKEEEKSKLPLLEFSRNKHNSKKKIFKSVNLGERSTYLKNLEKRKNEHVEQIKVNKILSCVEEIIDKEE
jgi:hypothetical protein